MKKYMYSLLYKTILYIIILIINTTSVFSTQVLLKANINVYNSFSSSPYFNPTNYKDYGSNAYSSSIKAKSGGILTSEKLTIDNGVVINENGLFEIINNKLYYDSKKILFFDNYKNEYSSFNIDDIFLCYKLLLEGSSALCGATGLKGSNGNGIENFYYIKHPKCFKLVDPEKYSHLLFKLDFAFADVMNEFKNEPFYGIGWWNLDSDEILITKKNGYYVLSSNIKVNLYEKVMDDKSIINLSPKKTNEIINTYYNLGYKNNIVIYQKVISLLQLLRYLSGIKKLEDYNMYKNNYSIIKTNIDKHIKINLNNYKDYSDQIMPFLLNTEGAFNYRNNKKYQYEVDRILSGDFMKESKNEIKRKELILPIKCLHCGELYNREYLHQCLLKKCIYCGILYSPKYLHKCLPKICVNCGKSYNQSTPHLCIINKCKICGEKYSILVGHKCKILNKIKTLKKCVLCGELYFSSHKCKKILK